MGQVRYLMVYYVYLVYGVMVTGHMYMCVGMVYVVMVTNVTVYVVMVTNVMVHVVMVNNVMVYMYIVMVYVVMVTNVMVFLCWC